MNDPNFNDATVVPLGNPIPNDGASAEHPQRIGRYRIERVLGQGGFGLVYLAHDEQLNRRVAMKVPHAKLISKPEDAEAYLAEARTVANLDYPGIVPVYDVGSTEDCPCYVVSKYIEGTDLAKRLKQSRLTYREAAELVGTVAEALHYAHKQGLVHRDIKPGNLLLDKSGRPFVADFGLALRDENRGKGPRYAGTPAYMSPEQARGEGHRVDGRSDIFALGVVFYELLVGRKPFRGDTQTELLEQITSYEPKPLLQYDEKLPKELQRICFKALSKRASDRYSSAYEIAEDLRLFLAEQAVIQDGPSPGGVATQTQATASDATPVSPVTPTSASTGTGTSDSQPIRIVPKGLRSFDAHDADFFLELLPGPRDRDGLPDSLRFWKIRIEEPDPDNTFSVGLIYGPSGCGKSSLVKAGLLPRLSEDVITVYIEATAAETETRLLHGLRKRCPALENDLSLKDTLAALRRGQGIPMGRKVLIVLDQFEQWLHAKKEEQNTELVQALRQCDGGRVQCIVMVRDDFWMAATRFGQDLEVDFVPGSNMAAVDLFPIRHAEKVLAAFGRAFEALPDEVEQTTNEQKNFVKQSVAGLEEEGKVICVRLSLFAEMMKGKAWTLATLKEVGGIKGVGVTFLEETFSSQTAVPRHRLHQQAARAVLRALLPNSGTDIKGEMKSRDELLAASGYANRPKDFDDLIRILDSEIRLITPTDPEGQQQGERLGVSPPCSSATSPSSSPPSSFRYYQLTHDYLVPSLRDWLTRKQRETRKGRAELKLAERSVTWNAKRENKQLPTVTEWLNIRTLTDSKRWTDTQRAMMGKAARVHGAMWGGLLLVVLLVGTGIQQWASAERETNLRQQTQTTVEAMQNNLGPSVPFNLEKLRTLPVQLVIPELQSRFISVTNARHKLSLAFALAGYGELDAEYLVSQIDNIAEADTRNYVSALQANPATALAALKTAALKCTDQPLWRRKAKLSIAALGMSDTELALDVCAFVNRPDPEQRTLFIDEFPKWDLDPKAVLAAIKNCDSPALRSGICLGVGQIPAEKIINADKESWKSGATQWFVEQGDTSTHSAAGWLLRQWGVPTPEVADQEKIILDRDWFVNTVGMTMLQMAPGSFLQSYESNAERVARVVEVRQPYWVGDREVTRGQFEEFINDANYAATEKPAGWDGVYTDNSPTADHPAQQVSWYDAVLYCNWLSQREALKACYERTGVKEKSGYDEKKEYDAWQMVPGTTGYRLLHDAEWEYACRAGTSTDFSSGNDVSLLAGYCQMYPSKLTATCGEKLPNAWGLYDVHGNVWEWCWEPQSDTRISRVLRGGGFFHPASFVRSLCARGEEAWHRDSSNGFRVARTLLPVPLSALPPAAGGSKFKN